MNFVGRAMRNVVKYRQMSNIGSFRAEPCMSKDLRQEGTRRIFTEEHDVFRASARKFFEKEVVPFHDAWEDVGQVPRELWIEAGKQGLLCAMMPEQFGGTGADILYSAIVWEEVLKNHPFLQCTLTHPAAILHRLHRSWVCASLW